MDLTDNYDQERRNREFVRLLGENELRLAGYIHTLIPVWHDAQDVLQETKLRLWEQFPTFELGTDFAAWAFTIAGYLVRAHRKNCQRRRVCFSDELIKELSEQIPDVSLVEEDRVLALVECVKKLDAAGRKLLRLFCTDRRKIKDIAGDLGQTPAAAYQALSRMRRMLFNCVEKRLQEENRR